MTKWLDTSPQVARVVAFTEFSILPENPKKKQLLRDIEGICKNKLCVRVCVYARA